MRTCICMLVRIAGKKCIDKHETIVLYGRNTTANNRNNDENLAYSMSIFFDGWLNGWVLVHLLMFHGKHGEANSRFEDISIEFQLMTFVSLSWLK